MRAVLGIDVGATWTRALLVDRDGRVLDRVKVRTSDNPLRDIAERVAGWNFDAVGIGSIGPLDLRSGWVEGTPNAPSRRFPLVEPLRRFGKPIVAANDCVAAVWGEHVFRYAGIRNMVYVTVSTGVGAGAIINGTLLLGKDGNAHELGHAVIDFRARRRCRCGGRGHLEAFVGGANICDVYREVAGESVREPAEIFERYRRGIEAAERFVDLWLDALAAGLATVAAAYDPELMIIGGAVALGNWDLLSRELPRRLREYLSVREPAIVRASFGDDEVAVGAAALAYKTPESLQEFGYPRL